MRSRNLNSLIWPWLKSHGKICLFDDHMPSHETGWWPQQSSIGGESLFIMLNILENHPFGQLQEDYGQDNAHNGLDNILIYY
ncbi:hypothetical protein XELAEV_18011145mg [Xenopus laevis]|uniref:Uncharacterized protein n=1 Tax=Xenopus laevis TaxID=8355 RepID=A0A974I2G9_XENLA|nr:hypothetical protein XELAEV_18011145mg [Xenopus laevis]